jgi:hypothetical protein
MSQEEIHRMNKDTVVAVRAPGYHTCPPVGEVPSDLLPPSAIRCRGKTAGFGQCSDSHPAG